jgi:hypothetical protein
MSREILSFLFLRLSLYISFVEPDITLSTKKQIVVMSFHSLALELVCSI